MKYELIKMENEYGIWYKITRDGFPIRMLRDYNEANEIFFKLVNSKPSETVLQSVTI